MTSVKNLTVLRLFRLRVCFCSWCGGGGRGLFWELVIVGIWSGLLWTFPSILLWAQSIQTIRATRIYLRTLFTFFLDSFCSVIALRKLKVLWLRISWKSTFVATESHRCRISTFSQMLRILCLGLRCVLLHWSTDTGTNYTLPRYTRLPRSPGTRCASADSALFISCFRLG